MDVAITGSTGLIGTALAAALESAGHRTVALVRPTGRAQPGAAASISWDPSAGRIDAAGLEGVGAVVHLAGAGIADRRWNAAAKAAIRDSRTSGTELLSTTLAGLQRPPAVLVSGSAIGIYGDRGAEVLTERSEPAQGFLAEVCTAWEAATAPASDAGIRVVHIRTGVVLDRHGGALAKMLPLFRLGLGGRLGSGNHYWSWITLEDEVGAIRHLLDHDVAGPVNLTAPNPVTNSALTSALGKVLHRPTVLPVPAFGPRIVLGAELADALLFSSARVLPQRLLGSGYHFVHSDIEQALRSVLQPQPRSA